MHALGRGLDLVRRVLPRARSTVELHVRSVGVVESVGKGVAQVSGLTGIRSEEIVELGPSTTGIALSINEHRVGVVLLGPHEVLEAGAQARRTGRVLDVPVGPELIGRVLDPLGRPLDHAGPVTGETRRSVEREAPAIIDRAPVTVPLHTGTKAIDALVPIGRGQRELIIGDRQTGKTSIALDAILNQRDQGVVCVYCAIGQRSGATARVIAALRAREALAYTVVIAADGDSAAGLQFAAPYAATTVAEYFMERGRDVLIVYDDLTRHAVAYRELSLLLRRPPGREAFPGDIFYIHSRLLERATRYRRSLGGGSLTALPIVETEAENIAGYIPTNLISITDGQVYLSPRLFQKGLLPAIDVAKSVSRVGGKTQLPAYQAVAGALRLSYAQFEELESFARFGTRLDDDARATIERGRRIREVLKQPLLTPQPVPEQVATLLAATEGLLDRIPTTEVASAEQTVGQVVRSTHPDLCRQIVDGKPLATTDTQMLLETMRRALPEPDRHPPAIET